MVTTARYAKPRMTRRSKRPSYSPLEDTAKMLADHFFERAMEMARALAPEKPADTEELNPEEQWEILEIAGQNLSPRYWDDPEAIRSLYQLRKQFSPDMATEDLLVYARTAEKVRRITPDPSITPENPKFKEWAKRVGIES